MKLETKDLVILGGGPAGLAAAIAAYDEGLRDILVIERDRALGEPNAYPQWLWTASLMKSSRVQNMERYQGIKNEALKQDLMRWF